MGNVRLAGLPHLASMEENVPKLERLEVLGVGWENPGTPSPPSQRRRRECVGNIVEGAGQQGAECKVNNYKILK